MAHLENDLSGVTPCYNVINQNKMTLYMTRNHNAFGRSYI